MIVSIIRQNVLMAREKSKSTVINSASMHNQNCYAYLKNLSVPEFILDILSQHDELLVEILKKIKDSVYSQKVIYGNVYYLLFKLLEKNLTEIKETAKQKGQEEQLDDFFFAIYHNDNNILNSVYKQFKYLADATTPRKGSNEKRITKSLKKIPLPPQHSVNHPVKSGEAWQRLLSNFGEYKSQYQTNIPSIRHYEYQNHQTYPTEYRFGTQGQRHHNDYRINPFFEHWLRIQKKKYPPEKKDTPRITHVYINNLHRDGFTPPPLLSEQEITKELEGLEDRHDNIAVITLPADGGLMKEDHYKKTRSSLKYDDVFKEFLAIALEDPDHSRKIKDFHISPKIRKLLFADEAEEKKKISDLIKLSFAELGIEENADLSRAERQAAWFHFCKFKLTDYILTTLNPVSVNFSCKDAIDRGGVSSAYYNLLKSFGTDHPMTQDEFNEAILAAPTAVKGRGINHHLKRLWNVIDRYVNANYEDIKQNEAKSWLIHWRDMNCPHSRVRQLIKLRVEQNINEIDKADNIASEHKTIAKKILSQAEQLYQENVSNQRLLLEVVSRTPNVLLKPQDTNNLQQFQKLQENLQINYPPLYVLAGLMKTLLGAIALAFTAGRYTSLLKKGWATTKAGFFAQERKEIITGMEKISCAEESIQKEKESDSENDPNPNIPQIIVQ
ncbi:hypothetical protein [Legionella israelensis]|nr:hypothetical protein [Legionella israelensis]